MLEKMVRISRLYDSYGPLLTERQQKCIEMHYLQDLSLGEIAAEFGVSRQAVNDILKRTEDALVEYESRLQLSCREKESEETLQQVHGLLIEAIHAGHPANTKLTQAIVLIERILK